MTEATPRTLRVGRTARYYTLGDPAAPEVWFVLHGYGQLAAYFARHFRPNAGPERCIVAPEALSRFYLDAQYERIGASWMTREERAAEIADTVAYLDVLAGQFSGAARFHVLGFSQGAAAASRWAAFGETRFERIVLWGGEVPKDLDLLQHGARFADLTLVYGDADTFATPARIADTEARLQAAGVAYRVMRYAGEHQLYAEPLAALMEESS